MSRYVFKMPDLGEGTVAAEVVAWHVQVGDLVEEDQPMCEIMTEKAAVDVPAPVTGRIVSLSGQPGDTVAVGADLVVFETAAQAGDIAASSSGPTAGATTSSASLVASTAVPPRRTSTTPSSAPRMMASPATRRRAHEAGIDLTTVPGTGPGGRI